MWGDYGVSRRLRLSNGSNTWLSGGLPVSVPLQQTGILEELRLLTSGSATVTLGGGTAVLDTFGPWNIYNLLTLSPNQQAPIYSVSGIGSNLVGLMKSIETQPHSPDTRIVSNQNAETSTDIYNSPTSTGTLRNYQTIPVSQIVRSLGGKVGMWPLQNPAVQLQFGFTPNTASTATPYNIYSLTAGVAPYITTGAATVTLGSPQAELIRNMWEVPANAADFPPFNLVSTWIEETPQNGAVAGATTFSWQATPLIGLLVRLGILIVDSNVSPINGIAASNLSTANALSLTYGANTPKFQESSYAALARQRDYYGFDMPQGFYCWDLLGQDLTLQDALDTNTVANIKLTVTANAALGSTSYAKVIRQILAPLEVR